MITVNYFPTDSDETTRTAPTLTDWFVEQFGADMTLPKGLRITYGNASRETDVTDEIGLGDPNGYLTRTVGEYNVVEVPGAPAVWIPIVISLVVSAAAVLLAPKPNVSNTNANRRQNSASNSLGNRSNEARPGDRYQDVRGFEPAIYADLLMTPHRRYESNREVEYVYGTATTGKGLISNPRDGATALTSIVNSAFNVYLPNTSPNTGDAPAQIIGEEITFPIVIAEKNSNVTGQELIAPNQKDTVEAFRATSSGLITVLNPPTDLDLTDTYQVGASATLVDWYSWEFSGSYFTSGSDNIPLYFRHSLAGSYEITAVTATTITLDVSAKPQWSFFGGGYNLRTEAYRQISTTYYSFDSIPFLFVQEEYIPALRGTDATRVGPFRGVDGAQSAWVNLLAQNGIRKAGTTDYPYSVNCQFIIYELTSTGTRTGTRTILPTITLSSNPILITDQSGLTVDFNVPYYYWEIEGRRTSNTDKDFNGTVIDEVLWAALYTVDTSPDPTFNPGDVTTVYAKIEQNPTALAVQERKLNFGVTRYERAYLGNGMMTSTQDTPSDEFADAVVGLALDPFVGKNVTLEQLNIDSLYAVQEEIVDYFGTRDAVKFGYSFSTTEMTFEDHLTLIAQAVFCRVFRVGNTYEFQFDRPRAKGETALLLNHRLKYSGSDKRNRNFTDSERKGYDGVVITYKDKDTLAFETIRIPSGTYPSNPLEVELSGVIYPQVASWYALREWNKIRYKRLYHETEAHSLARGLVPGDRITMANDTLTKSMNGQVLAQSGLQLRLADGVVVETGVIYSITLLYKSGTVENIQCQRGANGENWVQLFALPSEDLYTGNLELRTAYNLYEMVDADKDDMLVESMTVSIKNGQERVKVQAVNYDPRYWQGDPQEVSTGSFSTAFNDSFDKG